MGEAFAIRNAHNFWSELKKMNEKARSHPAQSVDVISGDNDIAELWASKLQGLFCRHSSAAYNDLYAEVTECVSYSHSAPIVADSLASFLSSVLRRGYMPTCIRDCILVPIPKEE